MAREEETTFLGCFGLALILALIGWGFIGWMIYELVMWVTSK